MANHQLALKLDADHNAVTIQRVIIDYDLQKELCKVPDASSLRQDGIFY